MSNSYMVYLRCLGIIVSMAFGITCIQAQALPIAIDEQYEDWTAEAVGFTDEVGNASGVDFYEMSVANDEQFLFIRFEIDDDIVLTDNNNISLFIDGDHNNLTGQAISGIGAELELRFGDREGVFHFGNSNTFIDLEDVGFHGLPNYSDHRFEIAIARDALPDGDHPLFTGNQISLFFRNGTTGDKMPNTGETFDYTFSDAPTPPYQPVDLIKNAPSHLRLVTWNTLFDGLLDFDRRPHFERVLQALQPDIVTFNECWDMTSGQAASFMNAALPLGNFQSWNAAKIEDGNITVSRYPILQNWNIYPGHRLMASLIDLPDDIFTNDILVVNGHLRCCDANSERQAEADAFARFILDAKSSGGLIDLPANTPFVLSGDMNLVGNGQQHTTLLTGDIQNTTSFGQGGPLDWDGTELLDVIALQADQRFAYTWHQSGSQYPPSRLDYHICSNSVLNIEKAYSLQTEVMSAERLNFYGLEKFDNSIASDHLPKVTDFTIQSGTSTTNRQAANIALNVSPNPATGFAKIEWTNPIAGEVLFTLTNSDGKTAKQWKNWHSNGQAVESINLAGLPTGAYWVELLTGKMIGRKLLILVK